FSALVNVYTIVPLDFVSNGALFAGKRPLIVHAVRVIVAVVESFFTLVDVGAFDFSARIFAFEPTAAVVLVGITGRRVSTASTIGIAGSSLAAGGGKKQNCKQLE